MIAEIIRLNFEVLLVVLIREALLTQVHERCVQTHSARIKPAGSTWTVIFSVVRAANHYRYLFREMIWQPFHPVNFLNS